MTDFEFSLKYLLNEHLSEFLDSFEGDLPNFASLELREAASCIDKSLEYRCYDALIVKRGATCLFHVRKGGFVQVAV